MAKIDVFISWSGQRSRTVAEALKTYLPMIVNDLNPWLSSADIDKGSRSTEEIATALANARAGIICLTPTNLEEPWVLFEAGAIAKTVRQKPLACTLLIGVEIASMSGPLTQFQATKPTESEMLALVQTLNKALGDAAVDPHQVKATFELCWPKLKDTLDHLPEDGPAKQPDRKPEDMLKELVELTRYSTGKIEDLRNEILERLASMQNLREFERNTGVFRVQDGILTTFDGHPVKLGGFAGGAWSSERPAAEGLLREAHRNQDEVPPPKQKRHFIPRRRKT